MTMRRSGPIEEGQWPVTIEGSVVDPSTPPRIRGYDVWHDLATHYAFADVVLTALRGELPTPAEARAFDVALTLASPGSIAEAPAHTAALARMLAVPNAELVAIGALMLAQQVHALVEAHGAWLAWLEDAVGDPPPSFLAATAGDHESVAAVRAIVDPDVCPVLVRVDPTIDATILALVHACGLRTPAAIVTALVSARLPAVIAESIHHKPAKLREYPIQLPPFEYEESGG